MMFAYFQAGPLRAGDQAMSVAMIFGWVCQLAGFLAGTGGLMTGAWIGMALFAISNGLFWSARSAHGANRPAAVSAVPYRR